MADGYIGLFKQPIEGAIKEGGKGFAKGLGKGTVGFLTKPASGRTFIYCPFTKMVADYTQLYSD